MASYVRTRLLLAIPTLFVVACVTFFLGALAPGSPVDIIMGEKTDPARRKVIEQQYGLDKPLLVRFGSFLAGAVRGDLDRSYTNADRSVTQLIAEQFPVTALVACLALGLAVLIGLPAGALAALKHNRLPDRLVMAGVLLLVSMPPFVLAPLLMLVFALHLGWLPTAGWETPAHMVLPVVVLAVRPAALLARLMRASMLDVIRQDYIRTAVAKGLSRAQVLSRHALKNAFLPVLTVLGNSFGYLLTGSFVVENIFSVPGIGYESVQSILKRDYPVIQGIALLVAALFILVNLVVDLLYAALDPRVRYEEAGR